MKNNIYFTNDTIRKLKNKIHKKTYNKEKGIRENTINEITIISTIIGKYAILELGKRFINKLKKEIGNQQKTTDGALLQETLEAEKPSDYE